MISIRNAIFKFNGSIKGFFVHGIRHFDRNISPQTMSGLKFFFIFLHPKLIIMLGLSITNNIRRKPITESVRTPVSFSRDCFISMNNIYCKLAFLYHWSTYIDIVTCISSTTTPHAETTNHAVPSFDQFSPWTTPRQTTSFGTSLSTALFPWCSGTGKTTPGTWHDGPSTTTWGPLNSRRRSGILLSG